MKFRTWALLSDKLVAKIGIEGIIDQGFVCDPNGNVCKTVTDWRKMTAEESEELFPGVNDNDRLLTTRLPGESWYWFEGQSNVLNP